MSDVDWSTPEGLAEIARRLAGAIDGWRDPVMYAVGLSSATSSPEWEFPHVNAPPSGTPLPAAVLATVLRHDGSTATVELTTSQLEAAVESLAPAEACTSREHPNLEAWRALLTDARANPARVAVAVFVADADDPVTSEADGAMRLLVEGHHPAP